MPHSDLDALARSICRSQAAHAPSAAKTLPDALLHDDRDNPTAWGGAVSPGRLRVHPQDFQVDEELAFTPEGTGEHVYLHIEKTGANTHYVARQLARLAGLRQMDVGYAGRKDRHAITRQWFSVWLPGPVLPQADAQRFADLESGEIRILDLTRHTKKLKKVAVRRNHFRIRIRDIDGSRRDLIEQRLAAIIEHGVPNYFGEQRFGRDSSNVRQGARLLQGDIRVRDRSTRGLYLSAVRSYLFNCVLAARVDDGSWYRRGDTPATGPLVGRGFPAADAAGIDSVMAYEAQVLGRHAEWIGHFDRLGFVAARRPLVMQADDLQSTFEEDDLILSFALRKGSYATALLRELLLPTATGEDD